MGALQQFAMKHATVKNAAIAVLHELENGEASEGNIKDIKWCAKQLREALGADAPAETPDGDGCPFGDPDCEGKNGDCHDACTTYAERGATV